MLISVELPDSVAHQLALDGPDSSRRALEMFALEGYREELLSRGQVGQLLGLGFYDTEGFLKENRAYISYTMEELGREMEILESITCQKQSS